MKDIVQNEALQPFLNTPIPGEIIKGNVISKEKSTLLVEISNFGTGIVREKEFLRAKNLLRNIKVGEEISAKIVEIDTENGFVELSISSAQEEKAWFQLEKRKDEGETFIIEVLKANKGGLMAEIEGIPSFLPVSQLSPAHYPKVQDGDRTEILKKLQKLIGEKLQVKIINLNKNENSLILSEKATTLGDQVEILKKYNVDDVVEGEITGITDFGAFIRFPIQNSKDTEEGKSFTETLEGLIHISELDWQLIHDPAEIVKIGQKVSAKIIEISNGKVSLSIKALKKDPWQNLKYAKGEIIKGEVVKFNPFGAFIKIKPKIQALCHISEFQNEKEMKQTLKIGTKYKFEISLISPEEHKMILKLAL